jgi:alanine dehydrogenase
MIIGVPKEIKHNEYRVALVPGGVRTLVKKGHKVLVDVAVDQGGCCETSAPTTHDNPVFTVDGVIHYCVGNMPSAVSRSATFALTNATFPYILKLVDKGLKEALKTDETLREGLNVYEGMLVSAPVAKSQGLQHTPLKAFS